MDVIFDCEANGLRPSLIWVAVCKELQTGAVRTFFPYKEPEPFLDYCRGVTRFIGHNILGYDAPHINRIFGSVVIDPDRCVDTYLISRLVDFDREEHSLESFSGVAGIEKPKISKDSWSTWHDEFIPRCTADVLINEKVYRRYEKYILSPRWQEALKTEHFTSHICSVLQENGFHFDKRSALALRDEISSEIAPLEATLQDAFPPKYELVKEVTPKITKFGTLSKVGMKFAGEDLSEYNGGPFSIISLEPFNPASAPQRIDRLWEAGWKPTEKTKGHKEFLKSRKKDPERKEKFLRYGWTCSEENLSSLPEDAPEGAKKLARWLLLIARIRKLDEWLPLVGASNRIHGTFMNPGAWTGRLAHASPNMGNIPAFNAKRPDTTPYSDRMRALFGASPGGLLVGVDAESIQLRVLAHYLRDDEFTNALLAGDKRKGTDPHSVNQRALGKVCKSRADAKTFIYAFLLGTGVQKVAEILKCSRDEAAEAVKNFLDRFENLRYIKDVDIPRDANRGYFEGLDGRFVKIKGEDRDKKEFFTLAGYLQNGESVIMKRAIQIWYPRLVKEKIPFLFVDFVHDEYQTEVLSDDFSLAKYVAQVQADAIKQVGEDLKLNCPMAGSFTPDPEDGHGMVVDGVMYSIGKNWFETH